MTVTPPAWLPSLDALRAERRWIDNRLYLERGGMANLQTKRGCHYKCTFCAYPVIEGRGMRTRDPQGVAAEVETLLEEYGLDQFFIVDSVFNAPRGYAEMASFTPESKELAKELKRRGFAFVGPTTVYSTMQAVGVVNDHLAGCFVRTEVEKSRKAVETSLRR